VLGAIEAVRIERAGTGSVGETSLWDLFALDWENGEAGKFSDRGECLGRLKPKTLAKLKGWLDANKEEAVKRCGGNRFVGLRADVGILARLAVLPSDEPLWSEKQDVALPFDAVGHKRSGRIVDLMIPVRLELLRRERGYKSERDLSKELGIPKSTLRDISSRMEEIGFSLEKFTTEDLSYAVRGPKHEPRKSL
jgi:hypothetical protein